MSVLTEAEIHEAIDPFIELCELFSSAPYQDNWDEYSKLAWAIFRRNLARHKALHELLNGSLDFAESMTSIMRVMVEDTVSIIYMNLNESGDEAFPDLEYLCERFFDFQWVQLKDDSDFYKSIGVDLSEDIRAQKLTKVEEEYAGVIEKYKNPDNNFGIKGFKFSKTENAHSWFNRSIKDMLRDIKEKQEDDSDLTAFFARAYIEGSRAIHLNPGAILIHLDDDLHGHSLMVNRYFAYVTGAQCMISLLRIYFDSIPPQEIWPDEDTLESLMNKKEDEIVYFLNNIASLHHLEE